MPTSSYMPDVKVEIAFDSGFATPAASRTWTDVSAYVELDDLITIMFGRQNERSQADANHLTLVLDNSDGRFTPGKTGGAYYPNVKLDRPIRVLATPVDGAQSTRFLGYIDEWPQVWSDGTDATSYVTIQASSRLARLGLAAGLKSIVEETILADGPAAYYTLGEPTGATQANDSSGHLADPLVLTGEPSLPMTFGEATGPGTDGLTAAAFVGGQHLYGGSLIAAGTALTLEGSFAITTAPVGADTTIGGVFFPAFGGLDTGSGVVLGMRSTGALRLLDGKTGIYTSSNSYADGATHHWAVTVSGTTWTLYVDGSALGSGVGTTMTAGTSMGVTVGGGAVDSMDKSLLTGSVAHVALFQSALSAGTIATHSTAMLTGFSAELTSTRLLRYAAYGDVPSAEISSETGSTTMVHIDTTDRQVVELMRTVETTEGGVLYDDRDGTLKMQNRAHRYTSSSIYTLTMSGEQEVEAGYAPKLDRSTLLNDVTAANTSSTVTARAFDQSSNDNYGHATGTFETASDDPNQPGDFASWLVYQYKEPGERTPVLPVNAITQVGKTPNCAAVMATTIGDKVTVAGRPSQASSASIDYFVEGYTETYGPESVEFVFNVSPSSPYDLVFKVDDATRGIIDTSPIGL